MWKSSFCEIFIFAILKFFAFFAEKCKKVKKQQKMCESTSRSFTQAWVSDLTSWKNSNRHTQKHNFFTFSKTEFWSSPAVGKKHEFFKKKRGPKRRLFFSLATTKNVSATCKKCKFWKSALLTRCYFCKKWKKNHEKKG